MSANGMIVLQHGGEELHANILGQGFPVLQIHGFGASMESWFLTWEALAKSWQVVAPDLPGFGRSTKAVRAPVLDWFCDWLVRLLDHLSVPAAHVVGNSMGGRVALHLALTRPERVRKLVLVDNRGFGPPDTDIAPGLVAAKTKEQLRTALLPAFHDPSLLTPVTLDRIFAMRQMQGAQAAIEQVYQGLIIDFAKQSVLHAQLPRIPHQTLVLWGRQDRVYAVEQAGRAKDIPNARVHIFENCGHVPQVEAQPDFNSVLPDFLAQP